MVGNVTGYSELISGDIFGAVYTLYNATLAGWLVAILFLVFQVLLYIKSRNFVMMWVTGLFFAGMYGISTIVTQSSVVFIFAILILELAGIIYYLFFK